MCTTSWARGADGYVLFFNRDERRTRGREEPPREGERGGVRYLAPRDGDAGGTWILVNERGLTLALLNGYMASRGPARETWTSRGELCFRLAEAANAASAEVLLGDLDLAQYQPFVLLALDPVAPARVLRWDGLALTPSRDGEAEMPLCSSGHDQEGARRARRARLAELAAGTGGAIDAALLARFQRDHGGGEPSAYTTCMHREDAATRSLVRVEVTVDEVRLAHAEGAPCEAELGPPLSLRRTRSSGSASRHA